MRPTVKAHLEAEVSEAVELLIRDLYERHMQDGVLHGSSFVLVRGRCALEELEMAVAAVDEVHEAAAASSLSPEETRVAGRVAEVLPELRRSLETLRGAFDDGK